MKASIWIDRNQPIGRVDPRVFGSFVEHLGRAVYGGIYEPGHANADEKGFRKDVMELVQELGVTTVRYPGGNFLSGYHWKNGIGPREERPVRLDLAWKQLETNEFGTDEFAAWCKSAGCETMMAVNMGTGSAEEAAELVEYCNFPSGSQWAEARIRNGAKEPYGFQLWCVGNEMDGDWQICSLTAEEYASKAYRAALMMKTVDPSISLVVCGSCSPKMKSFPAWDRTVMERTWERADYLSLHVYYSYLDPAHEGIGDFLASPVDFSNYIATARKVRDEVAAEKGDGKQFWFSVDEWNVWHTDRGNDEKGEWKLGLHQLENHYDFADALVVSGMLTVLLNNADAVKSACLAQLVNVIAPILTQPGGAAIRQTIFYPFQLCAHTFKNKEVLAAKIEVPGYVSAYGKAPNLYGSVCYDDSGKYTGFFVNVSGEEMEAEARFGEKVYATARKVIRSTDIHAKNTFEAPDTVHIEEEEVESVNGAEQLFTMAPYSIVMLEWDAVK